MGDERQEAKRRDGQTVSSLTGKKKGDTDLQAKSRQTEKEKRWNSKRGRVAHEERNKKRPEG